jgi:MOSC domain-containing protein YiiM
MKVLAVCTGKIKTYQWNKKEIQSAIQKKPQTGPISVHLNGLLGDEQANRAAHGGLDKAIYAFSADCLSFWTQELRLPQITFGQFGENLAIDHLDESKIFVGDTFEVGTCVLQVVQPREPCFKQEMVFNQKLIETFNNYGRCGIYFRVLKEGIIQTNDDFKLIKNETLKASIREIFEIYKDKSTLSKARALELSSIPSMNEKWRAKCEAIATSK